MKETTNAINIIESTNLFWRDSLRDEGVDEQIINLIYSEASIAVKHFREKYPDENK